MSAGPASRIHRSRTATLRRPVLLYSGTCRFCRWAARVVARLDAAGDLALLPLAASEAATLLSAVPQDTRTQSWWIVRRDGTAIAGKRGAAVALLAELRLTRWAARVLSTAGLSVLVDAVDGLVARHRATLSRLVPDGPAPQRYP